MACVRDVVVEPGALDVSEATTGAVAIIST